MTHEVLLIGSLGREDGMGEGQQPLPGQGAGAWSPDPYGHTHTQWDDVDIYSGSQYPGSSDSGSSGSGGGGIAWPAARPVFSASWKQQPDGSWKYMLVEGDTLAGLATTYLGAPQRWKEIWNVNTALIAAGRKPDGLYAGELIRMPDEAIDAAGLAGAIDPKLTPKGKREATESRTKWAWIVGSVVGVGALGAGGYLLLR